MNETETLKLLERALFHALPEDQEVPQLSLDASVEELGISSIVLLEMTGYIEEELGLSFPDDELAVVKRVADIAAMIQRQRTAATA